MATRYKDGTKVYFKHDSYPFYQNEEAEILESRFVAGKSSGPAKGRDVVRYRVRTTGRGLFQQVEQWVGDWDLTGKRKKK